MEKFLGILIGFCILLPEFVCKPAIVNGETPELSHGKRTFTLTLRVHGDCRSRSSTRRGDSWAPSGDAFAVVRCLSMTPRKNRPSLPTSNADLQPHPVTEEEIVVKMWKILSGGFSP